MSVARPSRNPPTLTRPAPLTLQIGSVTVLISAGLMLILLNALLAEGLWFSEVGYFSVFGVRAIAQGFLGLVPFLLSVGFIFFNLARADQQAWPERAAPPAAPLHSRVAPPLEPFSDESCELDYPGRLQLVWLLLVTVGLATMVAALLIYHGQVAVSHWQSAL
ncbi:MAG: UPF0182 family protein, partial [Elainellaceae cyanobacterium]